MYGRLLLGLAAFFFLACWVLSIASTCMQEWAWWLDPTTGVHEGLWQVCWSSNCVANNKYSGGCLALFNTVRAFSIITICMGFFAMLFTILTYFHNWLWPAAVITGVLTLCAAALPWSIYLGFADQCLPGGLSKGSGWSLAVAAFPMAVMGLILLCAWVCCCRDKHRSVAKAVAATAAGAGVGTGAALAGTGAGYGYGYGYGYGQETALAPAGAPVIVPVPVEYPAYGTNYPGYEVAYPEYTTAAALPSSYPVQYGGPVAYYPSTPALM